MQNKTPLFPGFHLPTRRRTPRTARQKAVDELAKIKQKSFSEMAEYLAHIVPTAALKKSLSGTMSRNRIFSKENTFWAFFSQILDADGGCQEVVRKLQAVAAMYAKPMPSSSTSGYGQARKNLSLTELETILSQISKRRLGRPSSKLQGRRVIVADGTGLSMPDTAANQEIWPQQRHQRRGCGFPQARLCACFDLQSGMLSSYELGNKKSSEIPLLRRQWKHFNEGDIFLGDKGFCGYYDLSSLADQGVDSVVTVARRKPVTAAQPDQVLGENDLLIHWKKPVLNKRSSYTKAQWEALPERLSIRQIRVTVAQKGFRTSHFYIATTLLDSELYPADELADLYLQRWDVELSFRDIKTTMGMDILRCKTPDMVRKEIVMHMIVYNCIRQLMFESAQRFGAELRRVSFKGSVQAIRQWEPHLNRARSGPAERQRLLNNLYKLIAGLIVLDRPGRREPRAVKRRPKPYQLMSAPRHIMLETYHRGKKHAKQP
jgi:hypothetical protein